MPVSEGVYTLITGLKHDKGVMSRGAILIKLSDSTITSCWFGISEVVRMADSDPRPLKLQKAGIRIIILPAILLVINMFALETGATSYVYLRGKEANVLQLKVLQVFVLCAID